MGCKKTQSAQLLPIPVANIATPPTQGRPPGAACDGNAPSSARAALRRGICGRPISLGEGSSVDFVLIANGNRPNGRYLARRKVSPF